MAAILGKIVSFLMLPFYAHIFEVEGYGVLGMIEAGLGVLTVLFVGAFSTAIMRIYHEQSQDRKGLALTTGIWLVWGLSVPIAVLPMLFSVPISRVLLGTPDYSLLICLSLASFFIDVAGNSASMWLIIGQRSVLYSFIGVARLILDLSLSIWLVIILRVGLIGVFIASLVTAAACSLVFHVMAFRAYGFGFDRHILVHLLRFQLPLVPGELISFFGRQAERILVRAFINLEGVGVLEMAYRFPPLLNTLISIPFAQTWRTKSLEIADQEGAPHIMAQMFSRYLFLMTFAGLILAVTMQDILELMTPPSFWAAARIAQIEILTTIVTGCTSYLSFGIIYRKDTKLLTYVRSVVVPIKVTLSVIMIYVWGLAGAAYSALIAEVITIAWILRKAQGYYRIPLQYAQIGITLAGGLALFFLLNGHRYEGFGPAVYARQQVLPVLMDFIRSTPLGEWRSGRLLDLFELKQLQVSSLFFNILFSLSFLSLIPILRRRHS